MSKLAIFGGTPVRENLFPNQNTYDHEEMQAVERVMKEGRLSGYRANAGDHFYGGPEVQALENEWAIKFNTKHAIACNSATSGLFIACGAIDIKNKEIIVSPFTMTCSATMPLAWGGIPIFADVEKDYFCIDADCIEKLITPKTKAIIPVSIFGQSYSWEINKIAKKHRLIIIEDACQAIGSFMYGKDAPDKNETLATGTLGDIGIFSLNFGKHITAGEMGVIVTDNDELAMKCRLLMNHGEAVQNDLPERDILYPKLFGFNLRTTEICAAIARVQLRKFDDLLKQRMANVEYLNKALENIPAITSAKIRDNCTHSYYVQAFKYQDNTLHRDKYINAVKAELTPRIGRDGEGVPIGCGYIRPINEMPVFESRGYNCNLPVVEKLYNEKLFLTLYHAPNSTISDMKDVAEAFQKVWEYRKELK